MESFKFCWILKPKLIYERNFCVKTDFGNKNLRTNFIQSKRWIPAIVQLLRTKTMPFWLSSTFSKAVVNKSWIWRNKMWDLKVKFFFVPSFFFWEQIFCAQINKSFYFEILQPKTAAILQQFCTCQNLLFFHARGA